MGGISATKTRDLQSALQMLRAGQYQQAHALLTGLAAANPGLPDVHWLLAGLYSQTNSLAEARRELQQVLQLDPGRASAHALLGEVLLRSADGPAAEQALRQALALQPNHLPAALNLAHLMLTQDRATQAIQLLDKCVEAGSAAASLYVLRGRALLMLRKTAAAVASFERAARMAPDDTECEAGLAAALTENRQPEKAETILRRGMQQGRNIPESHFVLARSLIAQNRIEEAIPELQRAVRARPDYFPAHLNLCELVWMRSGDAGEASTELDAALSMNPRLTTLRNYKAKLLEAAMLPERAISELETGISCSGESYDLCLAIAQIALKCDPPRALDYAERALHYLPDDVTAQAVRCSGLLGAGRGTEAAELALRLHRSHPENCHFLALLASAWRMLGDDRYGALYDYRFVVPQLIDAPPGWDDLGSYLSDLAAALRKLHTLHTHPIDQSLRLGSQTDLDFDRSTAPAIRAFARAIDGPIRRYLAGLGTGEDELRRRNTGQYRLSGAWSVRLRPHGYHVNHIHPDGWLSSACYIDLPPLDDGDDRAAWIRFGEPGFLTEPHLAAEHYVKPEPGMLVLFPSYMWHGTVPFTGGPEASRLTIAFDIIPG